MKARTIAALSLAFVMAPRVIGADVVWPALYFEGSLLVWWVIAAGLVMEFPFYYLTADRTFPRSLFALMICNLISTLAGILLIPLLGILWEFFPGLLLYRVFNLGTFNPITYGATFLLAVAANSFIEVLCLKKIYTITFTKKKYAFIVTANLLSVGLALIPVFQKYGNVFRR